MAHPLRSMNAQAVCDILLQIFMTFSIPRVISSDCGTNFTRFLTDTIIYEVFLGCLPRFNTPEASGHSAKIRMQYFRVYVIIDFIENYRRKRKQ